MHGWLLNIEYLRAYAQQGVYLYDMKTGSFMSELFYFLCNTEWAVIYSQTMSERTDLLVLFAWIQCNIYFFLSF